MLLKRRKKICDEKKLYVITEKLKPWIVIQCLKKENYIITDNQAETIALIIINKAKTLNILDDILKKINL